MPVKTKRDEHKWEKAKDLAAEKGHKNDYAYIMGIYKNMKPDYFKGKSAYDYDRTLTAGSAFTAHVRAIDMFLAKATTESARWRVCSTTGFGARVA